MSESAPIVVDPDLMASQLTSNQPSSSNSTFDSDDQSDSFSMNAQKSSATIEPLSASSDASQVIVDSDLVTANAELLRSQLAAVSMESFNPVETSPSVFSSQRPLVPYFFGRPDPLQRSYSTQYNFADLIASGDHRAMQAAQQTSAGRRARRAAAIASLLHPTEEELNTLRAQNPELYYRLAYGHPTRHEDVPAGRFVDPESQEGTESDISSDDDTYYLDDEEDEDSEEIYNSVGIRIPHQRSNAAQHTHAYGTHFHPSSQVQMPLHQAHAQIHHLSTKTSRTPTASSAHRTNIPPSISTTSTLPKPTSKPATGKRSGEPAAKRSKFSDHYPASSSSYWGNAMNSASISSSSSHRSHGKAETTAKNGKNVQSNNLSSKSVPKEKDEEERQKAREFWRNLPEDQRSSLIKAEKEQIMKKLKEQQKQPSCGCELCGKRRVAIEEELEMLYDAYYQELEKFSGSVLENMSDSKTLSEYPSGKASRTSTSAASSLSTSPSASSTHSSKSSNPLLHHVAAAPGPTTTVHSAHHAHNMVSHSVHYHNGKGVGGVGGSHASSTGRKGFALNSATLLSVADDFMKNDGKKFVEMMEELADAKLRREMRLEENSSSSAAAAAAASVSAYLDVISSGGGVGGGGVSGVGVVGPNGNDFDGSSSTFDEDEEQDELDEDEEMDEDDDDEDDDDDDDDDELHDGEEDEEYDDDDEYDDDTDTDTDATSAIDYDHEGARRRRRRRRRRNRSFGVTDEMKIEEGKQMLQLFAARMFEQRILAAYRDMVTREQQEKLIAEEEERSRQEAAKKEQKAKKKEREKIKKQQKHQEEIEERKRREKEEEEKQRQHKLEMERLAREREEKRKEEKRKEEEEKEKARLAQEAKRKADQERKKAEKVAKTQAKIDEQHRLDKERLERERAANFAANEKRKAEQAEKEKAIALEAKIAAERAEAEALASAKRAAEKAKQDAANERANKASQQAQQSGKSTLASTIAVSNNATVGSTKKKPLKSPLPPIEPPREPPSAAGVKKNSNAKTTAQSAAKATPSASSVSSVSHHHVSQENLKEPNAATPKRNNAKTTSSTVKATAASNPHNIAVAANNIAISPNSMKPRPVSAASAAQDVTNALPKNPKPLPAHPPPPLKSGSGVGVGIGALNTFDTLLGDPLFSSTPLLTSQELSAPIGKSWDALAAGLGRGFGNGGGSSGSNGGSIGGSIGNGGSMNNSGSTTGNGIIGNNDIPLLTTGSAFTTLAGMNQEPDLIFPSSPSPSSTSNAIATTFTVTTSAATPSPIDPLWMGTSVDLNSSSGSIGAPPSVTDPLFQSFFTAPHMPVANKHHQHQQYHQYHPQHHQHQQPPMTGLRGLLSDEDEVVHGHTFNNAASTSSSSQSMAMPHTISNTSSLLFPLGGGGGGVANGGSTGPNSSNDSFSTLPSFGNGFSSSLFGPTDHQRNSTMQSNQSQVHDPLSSPWSGFAGTPATSFSSLLTPPGFDLPSTVGSSYSDPSSSMPHWGYPPSTDDTSGTNAFRSGFGANPQAAAFYSFNSLPPSSSSNTSTPNGYYNLFSQ
jgi:hypothetical protein